MSVVDVVPLLCQVVSIYRSVSKQLRALCRFFKLFVRQRISLSVYQTRFTNEACCILQQVSDDPDVLLLLGSEDGWREDGHGVAVGEAVRAWLGPFHDRYVQVLLDLKHTLQALRYRLSTFSASIEMSKDFSGAEMPLSLPNPASQLNEAELDSLRSCNHRLEELYSAAFKCDTRSFQRDSTPKTKKLPEIAGLGSDRTELALSPSSPRAYPTFWREEELLVAVLNHTSAHILLYLLCLSYPGWGIPLLFRANKLSKRHPSRIVVELTFTGPARDPNHITFALSARSSFSIQANAAIPCMAIQFSTSKRPVGANRTRKKKRRKCFSALPWLQPHYERTMVCGFCTSSGLISEKKSNLREGTALLCVKDSTRAFQRVVEQLCPVTQGQVCAAKDAVSLPGAWLSQRHSPFWVDEMRCADEGKE